MSVVHCCEYCQCSHFIPDKWKNHICGVCRHSDKVHGVSSTCQEDSRVIPQPKRASIDATVPMVDEDFEDSESEAGSWLTDDVFLHCLSFLSGSDISRLFQVSQSWKKTLTNTWLWEEVLSQEFGPYESYIGPEKEEKQERCEVPQLRKAYKVNWELSTLKTLRWRHYQTDCRAISAREAHSACRLGDGRIYVFGGFESFGTSNTVYALDPATTTWTEMVVPFNQPVPRERYGQTSVAISDNSFVIFGGYSMGGYRGSLDDCWIFTKGDGDVGTFTRAPITNRHDEGLPTPRSYHAACFAPKTDKNPPRMFVFGGNNEDDPIGDLEVLDLETWTWSIPVCSGEPPCERNGASLHFLKNKLYLLGGGTGANVPRHGADLFDIHTMDLDSMAWSAPEVYIMTDGGKMHVPPDAQQAFESPDDQLKAPIARCHSAEVVGKNIVCFSGGAFYSQKLMRFDTESNCWYTPQIVGDQPHQRQAHICVRSKTRLYFYGGWASGVGTFNDVHVLDLSPSSGSSIDNGMEYEAEEEREGFRTTYEMNPSMLLFLQAFLQNPHNYR